MHFDPSDIAIDAAAIARGDTALDWPGLFVRLDAAHAARRVLARQAAAPVANGSFAPAIARRLAGFSSPAINQDAKAPGKPPRSIGGFDKPRAGPDIQGR